MLLWSWFIQPERDQLIDSVKWGSYPEHANTLNTRDFPLLPGGSIGRDGLEPDHWVRYQTPTPGMENGLPAPLAYYPFDAANVPSEEGTPFAWLDFRTREISYRLQVDVSPAFDSPLIDLVLHGTTHDVRPALAIGQYHWRVRSENASVVSAWSIANRFALTPTPPAANVGLFDPARCPQAGGAGLGCGGRRRQERVSSQQSHQDALSGVPRGKRRPRLGSGARCYCGSLRARELVPDGQRHSDRQLPFTEASWPRTRSPGMSLAVPPAARSIRPGASATA